MEAPKFTIDIVNVTTDSSGNFKLCPTNNGQTYNVLQFSPIEANPDFIMVRPAVPVSANNMNDVFQMLMSNQRSLFEIYYSTGTRLMGEHTFATAGLDPGNPPVINTPIRVVVVNWMG